ncbi:SSR1 [Nakaseomyces glabratus]|uniref:CFEM domain-containing protein n=1 Tax=Candida glabrata (strain ATCC 2001 / BCRC 20586 / JCM 3761 / NBRC 0622 / NRRL Y-65 / CBS 138) TaxID=284593 RepID=Q6FRS0_CANGA|nr:uncharacterized protein CAGL0H06413g [Nakaseomyces glabratus]KAH7601502.1 CFEM domain [Nakaseomyces glabratus]KAH7605882.1 CFEM domain [Nakaseomyces glabratus]QHS66715.1 SSR1 [Nakaseomyces glabratus]UVW95100.1 putative GPI-linked cell wall protein [Nakaseomyces glabratus]UVW95103.1 putative GPI-linked cell wall protein [Nakaseomyces glabratus]|eukprot:XP_447074.1 uncharacterized protein CAGL0H06413g [[Candida] glabrata]
MRAAVVSAVVLGLFSQVLATPPACLLACVAQVSKQSSQCHTLNQVGCFCENENTAIKNCLDSICPNGNSDAAYTAFKNSCGDVGKAVASVSSSMSSSMSSSASSSMSSSMSSSSSSSSSASSSISSVSSSTSSVVTTGSSSAPKVSESTTSTPSSTASSTFTITSSKPSSVSSTKTSQKPSSSHAISTFSAGANAINAGSGLAVIAAAALLI